MRLVECVAPTALFSLYQRLANAGHGYTIGLCGDLARIVEFADGGVFAGVVEGDGVVEAEGFRCAEVGLLYDHAFRERHCRMSVSAANRIFDRSVFQFEAVAAL